MNASNLTGGADPIRDAMLRTYFEWDGKDARDLQDFIDACAADHLPAVVTQRFEDGTLSILAYFASLDAAQLLSQELRDPESVPPLAWRYLLSAVYDNQRALMDEEGNLNILVTPFSTHLWISTHNTGCGPLVASALFNRLRVLDDWLRTFMMMRNAPQVHIDWAGTAALTP
jgi:hypothetical protein